MGKKKSVVLMTLLTIVMVVLCFITAFPSFAIPGTVKKWNSGLKQGDWSTDFTGGYYTYYYPEGVKSEAEYRDLTDEAKEDYYEHKGLYLNKDEDYGIIEIDENGEEVVSEDFKAAFERATEIISARYAARYSDFSVAVVDDYALRIVLPDSEVIDGDTSVSAQNAADVVEKFSLSGALTLATGSSSSGYKTVEKMASEELTAKDVIKSVEVKDQYETAYLRIEFTSAGREILDEYKTSAESDTSLTLVFQIGDETVSGISITSDHISKGVVKYYMQSEANKRYVKTYSILLNSAINNGTLDDISFETPVYKSFDETSGKNTLNLTYIALGIVMVAAIVFAIVKMNKFGVVSAYLTVSYFIITALCFVFITEGVLELTLGSVMVYLAGLLLVNALQGYIYNAIKAEFALGKTVASSVKGGYKKTLWTVIDLYAVLLLGGIAFLFASASLHTIAIQMIICVVTGAFCNLLWGRGINHALLSAAKDKYKYFRFVREDDDDE